MKTTDNYILVDKQPVEEPDFFTWAMWFEKNDRHVKQEYINGARVSTAFLGTGYVLFETMIFHPNPLHPFDYYQQRCMTWEEAEKMHAKAVAELILYDASQPVIPFRNPKAPGHCPAFHKTAAFINRLKNQK